MMRGLSKKFGFKSGRKVRVVITRGERSRTGSEGCRLLLAQELRGLGCFPRFHDWDRTRNVHDKTKSLTYDRPLPEGPKN
jgi:hypothetical protein